MKKNIFLIFFLVLYLHSQSFTLDPKYSKIKDYYKNSYEENSSKGFNTYLIKTRTHRVGAINMLVNNFGTIHVWNPFINPWSGADYIFKDECTGKDVKTLEMPAGSGMIYLRLSSLWIGGYLESKNIQISGVPAIMFDGPNVSTGDYFWIYPMPELLPTEFENDPEGWTLGNIYESSNIQGRLNCMFEQVYDPKATAYEQFTTMFTDKCTSQHAYDYWDDTFHSPLGIEIKQTSYAWPYDYAKKFIIVDYTFYNRNKDKRDIYDMFIGNAIDNSVYNEANAGEYGGGYDDLCGFIDKWAGYIDPATGQKKTVDLNMVWAADNDGREYSFSETEWEIDYEPGAGSILDGATGVYSIRVLRNPNPNLRYSYNNWSGYANYGWAPKWKVGMHDDWLYDLTPEQRGYDDDNNENVMIPWGEGGEEIPLYGGVTNSLPMSEKGRYMLMSNDEFDHNQTAMREIYIGMDTQIDGTPIPQADKWQPWIVSGTVPEGEYSNGSLGMLNDFANGYYSSFLLGFGPLGYESYVNVAVDRDLDGEPDDVVQSKKVWKFAYGDSLKLTLAIMVSDDFHTSLAQDPNYVDSTVVDLTDGLDVSLYDQGWYDAFNNVVWAERVFDTPMYDTPLKRWGETKKDGWFGEDVGADGIFGDFAGDAYCWWLDSPYIGPDTGENDYEMTTFNSPVSDYYGNTAETEDTLLPFGRQHVEGDYGISGSLTDGEGYGYMVKYDKPNGVYPQGSWIRYGFDNGRIDAGDGVPDFTSPPAPPPPKIKVTELDDDITVEWTSHEFYEKDDGSIGVAGPEFTFDPYTRLHDFEGYHVELSPDRQLKNFTTIFSVDLMNYAYQNVADPKDYYDNPVLADTVYAHPEDYPYTVTVGPKIYKLVPFGDNRDLKEGHSVGSDMTFTCTTEPSPYPEWDEVRNYKFILHNQILAQQKFIAVTASDYGAPKMGVPAIKSSPESNATATVTSTISKSGDVIVVPNPYRGDADYAGMGWEVLDGKYTYQEEYRKLVFLNIPDRCVIRIYTLAGDLVKVIAHNGNSEWNTPYWYGTNGAYWNLISDNNQAVVSGIYLFNVQDADNKKDDFVGKFVIIK
ncbi:TPA: hypothetical protein DCR49_09770 [Candidatus Delongbacteria bacterium]|nr:hypothetical protein [Candidatus Delongbacteria bacterium]